MFVLTDFNMLHYNEWRGQMNIKWITHLIQAIIEMRSKWKGQNFKVVQLELMLLYGKYQALLLIYLHCQGWRASEPTQPKFH